MINGLGKKECGFLIGEGAAPLQVTTFTSPEVVVEFYQRLLEIVWFTFGMTTEEAMTSYKFLENVVLAENGAIILRDWNNFALNSPAKNIVLVFIRNKDEQMVFNFQVTSRLNLYKGAYHALAIIKEVT
jgi:hypothetical protein